MNELNPLIYSGLTLVKKHCKKQNFLYLVTLISLLITSLQTLVAQNEIPCDLVELSNKALGINPILLQNKNQILSAEGGIQIQQGVFNPVFLSGISYQDNRSNLFDQDPRNELIDNNLIETETIDFTLGLQKTFRNGLFSTLNVDYADVANNFPLNQFNQNVRPFLSNHTFSSTLALTQPLLRGSGIKVATALEKAAILRSESVQNNYQNESAFQLLQIAVAYWQYTAAFQNWLIYKENEDRVANVLRITKELVKADKKPAGDLVQIQADLANQQRLTNTAFQNFQNSKINLGRAVGLNETESEALSIPLNTFPEISTSGVDGALLKDKLLEQALINRNDLQAFQKEKEALMKQVRLAANNRNPELNLTGFVSYGGTNFGNGIDRAFSAITNKDGSNYTVGVRLNLSLPILNQTARGTYLQQKTALDNQEIATDNLERNISLNVNIAVTNVENSASILKKAKETLTYSQEVFTNEQIKFKNGLTTLLNLILFQERLTFAQLEYQQAQLQFAVAIANLRYETGTLVAFTDSVNTPIISKQQYYTVPKT
ncbi:TolC family protein [Aquimarina sp. ERC-38]|uniref:TolC family protein n=1 Tax=Aquimarina sp. ERC-38 TaxID=2949996 RepID=UPI0022470E2F|nr:TolC family protein [Aquimarina sp. ERC-38]UZO82172.1 TolC family protein [Aquimarina sp. ERC-38]